MTTDALAVLAVSSEQNVLRRLHWLLSAFGYRVQTIADPSRAFAQMQSVAPRFLILDSGALNANCDTVRELLQQRTFAHPYTLLLCDDQSKINVLEAFEAGVDDFLEKPVNNAEVLARLRAGARYLEFERRAGALIHTDPLTGLLTRESVVARMQREADQPASRARAHGCILLEVDFYDELGETYGWAAQRKILQNVAHAIGEHSGKATANARWEGARFFVILPDKSIDETAECGERIRSDIAQQAESKDRQRVHITLSIGVGAFYPDRDPVCESLRMVTEALQAAKEGGGDCLVRVGEFESDREQWHESLRHGNPFSGAKASHAMTPFAYSLDRGDTVKDAGAKLERYDVGMLPVVDSDQRILGLVQLKDIQSGRNGPPRSIDPVESIMSNDYIQVDADSSFAFVMKHLFDNRECRVVVVDDSKPQGLITFHTLCALAAPLSGSSFAAEEPYDGVSLERLVVSAPEIGDPQDGKQSTSRVGGFVSSGATKN